MEKILLAVDGSSQSEKAAKKAGELVVALEAEVTILTVVEPVIINSSPESVQSSFALEGLMEEKKNEVKEQGNKILNKIENIIKSFQKEKDIKINKLLSSGDPAEYICEEAENNDYDLIILADKGEGGVKRFLLGSTSDKVVHYSDTSVMIVK